MKVVSTNFNISDEPVSGVESVGSALAVEVLPELTADQLKLKKPWVALWIFNSGNKILFAKPRHKVLGPNNDKVGIPLLPGKLLNIFDSSSSLSGGVDVIFESGVDRDVFFSYW